MTLYGDLDHGLAPRSGGVARRLPPPIPERETQADEHAVSIPSHDNRTGKPPAPTPGR